MRPDEHKKRKNAQYKKKHGLTTQPDSQGKKEKTKSTDKKSTDRAKSDGSKKPEIKHVSHDHQASKSKPTENDGSDSDEQVFRRRNLVNNWSRYDDLPDDDDDDELPSQRGEDFNKILAAAGGSAAQFRFHDEEDWESMGDSSVTSASVLAVNLEDLQQSLSCLPLQQRLGISEDLFSESQLKDMNDAAASNELVREKSTDAAKTSAIHKNKDPDVQNSEKDKNCAMNVKDQEDHSVLDKVLENSVDSENKLQQNIVTVKTIDARNKSPNASNLDSLKTTDAKTSSKTRNSDASIPVNERPLSERTASQSGNKESVIPVTKKKVLKDETSCLEDDLDMLLCLDKPNSADANVVTKKDLSHGDTSSVKEKVSKENKQGKDTAPPALSVASGKENNLEDWLDSMLDD